MIRLDAASVLLQWATGGLFFLWITTRRREVGLGDGWMMRATFGLMALGAFGVSALTGRSWGRDLGSLGVFAAAMVALGVSVARRRAGVAGQRARVERSSARVAAMTGIDRDVQVFDKSAAEFPPAMDLVAPIVGAFGLVFAGFEAGGPWATAVLRLLSGALFLGAVTDAMLLGHWYLVQPGLARAPLRELVRWCGYTWPVVLVVLLLPTGMISVLSGSIDDGYAGLLGWFWVACTVATIVLVLVTWAALKERQYSAVMAATGLLYLAILTAFGMDLVARAVLS
ncbi:MAG: hypothetical protein IT196_08365 [Acidimicrobiales bacterium]|nr:hypothetical protein [Acidimicrobiales bacterium]